MLHTNMVSGTFNVSTMMTVLPRRILAWLRPVASIGILRPICLLKVLHEGGDKKRCWLLRENDSQESGCRGLTCLANIMGKSGIFGKAQVVVLCDLAVESSVVKTLEMKTVDGIDVMPELTKRISQGFWQVFVEQNSHEAWRRSE